MDGITKDRLKMLISGTGDRHLEAMRSYFPEKLLKDHPDEARDMLDYLYENEYQARKNSLLNEMQNQTTKQKYDQRARDITAISGSIDLLRFQAMADIYAYIYKCISSEMDDDGNIRTKEAELFCDIGVREVGDEI